MNNGTTGSHAVANVDNTIAAVNANTFLGISNNGTSSFGYWVNGNTIDVENLGDGSTGTHLVTNVDNTLAAFSAGTLLGGR